MASDKDGSTESQEPQTTKCHWESPGVTQGNNSNIVVIRYLNIFFRETFDDV